MGRMNDPSAPVTSRQSEPHPRLAETVLKHRANPWLKPIAEHSRQTFASVVSLVAEWPRPLILDAGCGTGMSTSLLADRYPDHLVLGVDKSAARLSRSPEDQPVNARLIRMDLEDFWPLARQEGWRFERQCFFYPNPWPKPEHRLRRWPFHPVLPLAVACGGVFEVRTNWEVYAREFSLAFGLLTGTTPQVTPWRPPVPETLFEKKYLASGHALWRWEAATGEQTNPPD
jgi:tRNA G46 methylase TrmB